MSDCNWAKIDMGKVNRFSEHAECEGNGAAGHPWGRPAYWAAEDTISGPYQGLQRPSLAPSGHSGAVASKTEWESPHTTHSCAKRQFLDVHEPSPAVLK